MRLSDRWAFEFSSLDRGSGGWDRRGRFTGHDRFGEVFESAREDFAAMDEKRRWDVICIWIRRWFRSAALGCLVSDRE